VDFGAVGSEDAEVLTFEGGRPVAARSFFNRPFSRSSFFNRFASSAFIPPYWFRHR
jgi:hypothetical protein